MKRLTSLILAIILFLLSLSAVSCSDSTGDDIPTDTATSTEVITTEAPTETEPPMPTNTFDISDFSIVCPDSDTALLSFAMEIKDAILEKTGAKIPLGRESKERDKEIILGNCNRDISNDFFKLDYADAFTKYGVIAKGSKIFLVGNSTSTVQLSAEYFAEKYLTNSSKLEIGKEVSDILEIPLDKIGIPARKNEGEIRVVSNNIMFQSLKDLSERPHQLSFAMKTLDADVVLMQEVDSGWNNKYNISSLMSKLGFSRVNVNLSAPIFYKSASFKIVEYGSTKFDATTAIGANYNYVWAVLEQISTQKKIIVVSSHFIYNATDEVRDGCAEQLATDMIKLSEKHGGAVAICGGDYNFTPNASSYAVMKKTFDSARDSAKVTVNMEYATENGYGKIPKVGGAAIDHIFYLKGKIEPLHFETVVSPFTYSYADHVPVCFDFKLK